MWKKLFISNGQWTEDFKREKEKENIQTDKQTQANNPCVQGQHHQHEQHCTGMSRSRRWLIKSHYYIFPRHLRHTPQSLTSDLDFWRTSKQSLPTKVSPESFTTSPLSFCSNCRTYGLQILSDTMNSNSISMILKLSRCCGAV